MAWSFNPFTGNLDLVGGGGTVVFEGEVETFADLPETVGDPAVGASFLVRSSTGVWLVNRRQAGIWIRKNNTGVRATDWEYGGDYPVNSVNGQTGNVSLTASSVGAAAATHASTHHTGGTDAIAPNQISAAWAQVLSGQTITGDTLLLAGRNRRITLFASGITANVDLPYQDNQAGDTVTLVASFSVASTLTIRRAFIMSGGVPGAHAVIATLISGRAYTFVSDGTATGWALRNVDTHTHAAADISDSTATGRSLLTASDALAARAVLSLNTGNNVTFGGLQSTPVGNLVPAAGTFTNLSANTELQIPSAAAPSPSAGDIYRISDQIRYRDAGNTERALLNSRYRIVTGNTTAATGEFIAADTTAGAFTLTLPAAPANGDTISILDYAGTFDTNNLTIARNGSNIESLAEDMDCNIEDAAFSLVFVGSTVGWKVVPYFGNKTNFASPDPIGSSVANTGAFTNLSASGTLSGAGFSNRFASPGPIGSTTPSTGAFTTLNANNGTVTTSTPALTVTQVLNNAAVAFDLSRLEFSGTGSSVSAYINCINNGSGVFSIRRTGVALGAEFIGSNGFRATGGGNGGGQVILTSNGYYSFCDSTTSTFGTIDLLLRRDAAGILAQHNLANPQTFRIYNTTDAGVTNFERGFMRWSSNTLEIGMEAGGTGSNRNVNINIGGQTATFSRSGSGIRLACRDVVVGAFIGSSGIGGGIHPTSTGWRVRNSADTGFGTFETGALTINGNLDASTRDIVTDTTTGTKIGTGTTQKLGFWNAAPSAQPAAVADATDAASTQARLNDLLARLRTIGIIAT